jgi:hypothetical protein
MKAAYLFLKKHGVSISFILGTILSVISVGAIIVGFPEGATTMDDLYGTSIFNPALNISYILIIATSVAAIIGPAIYTILYFKESIKPLIMFVAVIAMYFISISLGVTPNAEELTFYRGVDNEHLAANTIKYIDGLLIFTSITIFLTMCSLVFMGIWGIIKQR